MNALITRGFGPFCTIITRGFSVGFAALVSGFFKVLRLSSTLAKSVRLTSRWKPSGKIRKTR